MKYHIKITDNETGKIKIDSDAKLIIFAYADNKGVQRASLCGGATNEETIYTISQLIKELAEDFDFVYD